MSVSLFIQHTHYVITLESETLRKTSAYEAVRSEINRRLSPLSGGVDWEQVRTQCEHLAKGLGVDLLMAGYWSIANLKTQGLDGFANGLELLNAIVSMLSSCDVKTECGRKDILTWVNARAVEELKALKPGMNHLRALYRCERYCEQLHRMMAQLQPSYSVNYENIGFALFEHIDRLEAALYTEKDVSTPLSHDVMPLPVQSTRTPWLKRGLIGGALVVLALCGVVAYQWQYFHFERVVDVARLAQQDRSEVWQPSVVKHDVVAQLTQTIAEDLNRDVGDNISHAQQALVTLERLYPEEAQPVSDMFHHTQHSSLARVDEMVERFSHVRTQVANMAKQYKGRAGYSSLATMETYAVSLSPVYGRIEYIERLLRQGQQADAEQEFDILTERLKDLHWKLDALQQQVVKPSFTEQKVATAG
ncbi:type VI secretion system ImpA family N-terminal domain-containing protein [Vibrio parahaemolyticus]|uniref:type VI secretion system ImpA family N-terminal domain-containing protein n=1 Tax=Vibrio parahaemolyticus TaxID=670 RepID=UPI001D16C7E1|nr:type VI secretion system ImpA family N-terminal domain-containing protein [Vibrio parahaemolyticus]MCC3796863.1 type VI secretion system ImpA family N-terminal domain-containing protein [Vibrio parahaemolyticus]MCC3811659.1 type VI secretion system ImpA family N-terminal domain-containing protein [Vibrio parahaemolyticus]